jgi:hypothetical protein
VPELRQGEVVNLSATTGRKRARGSKRQAPVFSTFRPIARTLNPIENAFAKAQSPAAQSRLENRGGLWTAIGRIVDLFVPDKCRNYFAAARYEAT